MQFNVPQFEVEDKIFGPFTVIQFLYISIALAISFFLFPVLATWFWLVVSIILVGGSLMIALVKIGGRSMLVFLLAAAHYLWNPKTLILISSSTKTAEPNQSTPAIFVKKDTTPPVVDSIKDKPVVILKTKQLNQISLLPSSLLKKIRLLLLSTLKNKPVVIENKTVELKQSTPAIFVKKDTAPSVVDSIKDKPVVIEQDSYTNIPITPTTKEPISSTVLEDEIKKNDSSLQNLFNKMLTYSSPIPFREISFKKASLNKDKEYESVQKPTGETIVAQRIDYR